MILELHQTGLLDCLGQFDTWVSVEVEEVVIATGYLEYTAQPNLLDFRAKHNVLDYAAQPNNLDYTTATRR